MRVVLLDDRGMLPSKICETIFWRSTIELHRNEIPEPLVREPELHRNLFYNNSYHIIQGLTYVSESKKLELPFGYDGRNRTYDLPFRIRCNPNEHLGKD